MMETACIYLIEHGFILSKAVCMSMLWWGMLAGCICLYCYYGLRVRHFRKERERLALEFELFLREHC